MADHCGLHAVAVVGTHRKRLRRHQPAEALRHYQVGARIGELSLDADFSGVLPWGIINNRPYLRCLHGYGLCLWQLGRLEEAAVVLERLLWLNPNDNQGLRDILAAWYLQLDRDADLAALLESYAEDGSAVWLYTRGLLAFRREGDGESSRSLLAEAFACNPHVSGYLLGKPKMPKVRLGVLRDAYRKALESSELRAEAKTAKRPIEPLFGENVARRVEAAFAQTPTTVALLKSVLSKKSPTVSIKRTG